jgi:hypothetical protein
MQQKSDPPWEQNCPPRRQKPPAGIQALANTMLSVRSPDAPATTPDEKSESPGIFLHVIIGS